MDTDEASSPALDDSGPHEDCTDPMPQADKAEVEADAVVEQQAEAEAEVDAEAVVEQQTEADAEADVEPEPAEEPETEVDAQPAEQIEADPDLEPEAEAEADPEPAPEPEVEDEVEAEVEAENEPEVEAEIDNGPEVEAEVDAEVEAEPEPEPQELEAKAEVEAVVEAVVEAEPEPEPQPQPESKPEAEPAVDPSQADAKAVDAESVHEHDPVAAEPDVAVGAEQITLTEDATTTSLLDEAAEALVQQTEPAAVTMERRYTADGKLIPIYLKDSDEESSDVDDLSIEDAKEWAKRQRVLRYKEAKWKEDAFGSQENIAADIDMDTLEGQNYSLCLSRRKLGILGVGTALYFKDLKYFRTICIILFLMHVPGLYENWNNGAHPNVFVRTTLANANGDASFTHLLGDFLHIMVYLLLVYLFQFRMSVNVRTINRKSVTAGDYAIMVSNLPKRMKETDELAEHFRDGWGQVAAIELAMDNTRLMAARSRRVRLENRHEHHRIWEKRNGNYCFCISCARRYERKLDKNQGHIDRLAKAKYHTLYAFVTLQETNTRRDILKDYNPSSRLVRWYRRFFCLCTGKKLKFRGKRLKVQPAPEPSDIIWENLHYSKRSRTVRGAIVLFVSLSIVGANFQLLQLMKAWFAAQNQGAVVTSILSSMVVIAANLVLRKMLFAFGKFVKPASKTEYEQGVMINVFVAELLNTAGPIVATYPIAPTDQWYSQAGATVLLVMLSDALASFRNLVNPTRHLIHAIKRRHVITQQELNQVYLGPEFHLSEKYALFLKTMYLAVMFGGGLPHVYLVAALNMFLTYWSEKALLLRRYRRPPMLKERLAHTTLHLLPYATVPHIYAVYKFMFAPEEEQDQYLIPWMSVELFIGFFLMAFVFFSSIQAGLRRLMRKKKIDTGKKKKGKESKPYSKVPGIERYISPANEAAGARARGKRTSTITSPVSPSAASAGSNSKAGSRPASRRTSRPASQRASVSGPRGVTSPISPTGNLAALPEGKAMSP